MKKLLHLDDDPVFLRITQRFLEQEGWEVNTHTDSRDFFDALAKDSFSAVLLDLQIGSLSGLDVFKEMLKRGCLLPVFLCTAHGSVATAVEAVKLGAQDYLLKPVNYDELRIKLDRALTQKAQEEERISLQTQAGIRVLFSDLVAHSPSMQKLLSLCRQAKDTDATLLLLGETGTGKGILAKALHFESVRREKPFVVADCASIQPNLLESDLFGHEKGAFTDAHASKEGKFELAGDGTLFLDEIGELPLDLQKKLLRVLQEKEFERVGATKTRKSRCRLIAATNKNLKKMTTEGTFREDLFFRLNVFPVEIPPLRERKEEIPKLAESFVRKFSAKYGKTPPSLSDALLSLLETMKFPGNVRELEHLMERSVILSPGSALMLFEDLSAAEPRKDWESLPDFLARQEKQYLLHLLEQTQWDTKKAAEKAGVTRKTIYQKIQERGLSLPGKKA